jgi:RND family efflux transporter MFP subunit
MNKGAFALALSLAVITVGCSSRNEEARVGASAAPITVKTVTVSEVEWPSVYEASGTVRARTTVQISSRLMAYVRKVRVRVGNHVRQGQVLVTLDAADIQTHARQAAAVHSEAAGAATEADQAVESAKANLDLAEATFRRMKDLHDKRSLSNQEFDEATMRVRAARASLEMAEARRKQAGARITQADEEQRSAGIQLGYATLTAPFSGVIVARNTESGNLASPGVPLLTLEKEGGYRLEVEVPESKLPKVRTDQQVDVQLDSQEEPFSGRVTEIVPAIDPSSHTFTVKVDLPTSPQIHSGLFGRARFPTGVRNVLAVPITAVVQRGQMQWVLVVENQTAHARIVSIGDHTKDQVEVLSGLTAGEKIVAPAPATLADGARLEVRP